jgi:hypothetical protein
MKTKDWSEFLLRYKQLYLLLQKSKNLEMPLITKEERLEFAKLESQVIYLPDNYKLQLALEKEKIEEQARK